MRLRVLSRVVLAAVEPVLDEAGVKATNLFEDTRFGGVNVSAVSSALLKCGDGMATRRFERFGRGAFGLPFPRQQAVDFGRLGPTRDNALEDVGEIGERFDVV